MNTMTFFQRLSRIFKPKTGTNRQVLNQQGDARSDRSVQQELSVEKAAVVIPQSQANLPLRPVVEVRPATLPQSMAASEYQRVRMNDLKSWAMDGCIAMNGNSEGMKSTMEIIVMNSKLEASAREEELKSELVTAINGINDEVIRLNNEIAMIREFHIPAKEKEINQGQSQMGALEANRQFDVQTQLGSDYYTVLATSVARNRQHIRDLQQKILELKTQIDQKENKIKTLREQMSGIQLFNEDVVSRRINIFFNGWLIGLEGIGARPAQIDACRKAFDSYTSARLKDYLNN